MGSVFVQDLTFRFVASSALDNCVDSFRCSAYGSGMKTIVRAGAVAALTVMAANLVPGAPASAAASTPARTCVANPRPVTSAQVNAVTKIARKKIAKGLKGVGLNSFPSGALNGQTTFTRTSRYGWTAGFFPAEVWLMYQQANTKSARKAWLKRARSATKGLLPLATYTGTHDLGFMVGLPIGLAMKLDPNKAKRAQYRSVYRRAAASLAKRWNPNVGAIQSDTYEGEWGLIVDSAMNAPLLIGAGQSIGGAEGARLVALGKQHMRTVARYFVRADGSTIHRLKFDRSTGELIGSTPGQGLSSSSTWSRGQAWAIYGFAQAYGLTGDPEFLSIATRAANYWLRQLPDGCVPAWDFNVMNASAPRDSSASAIAAAGLLHLARVAPSAPATGSYRRSALAALGVLARPSWSKPTSRNPGILQRQSHAIPIVAREGSYTWGDAYFLQALYSNRPPG